MAKKTVTIKNPKKAEDTNLYLDIEVDEENEVVSKTIPDPTDFENGKITWFNAFEVKPGKVSGQITLYKVKMKRPAPVDNKPRRLFYEHQSNPHEISPSKLTDEGGGFVSFSLNLGDPPVGYYP